MDKYCYLYFIHNYAETQRNQVIWQGQLAYDGVPECRTTALYELLTKRETC